MQVIENQNGVGIKKSPTWSCVSYRDPQLQVGENGESFKQYHM